MVGRKNVLRTNLEIMEKIVFITLMSVAEI